MFFCPNQLWHPYRTRSYIMSEDTPSTRPPQTSQLFGELASLVHLRLSLLGIFTGEFVSPYFHYWLHHLLHSYFKIEPAHDATGGVLLKKGCF